MSYSFSVRAGNRADALQKIGAQLDKVVEGQPMHSRDREPALAAAKAFLELLPESQEGHELSVSMHGSIGWNQADENAERDVIGAGVGVSAALVSV